MRLRTKLVAGTVTVAAIAATAGSFASAADEVPWYQRPVTLGTGFAQNTGSGYLRSMVSQSGQWVVFAGEAPSWDQVGPTAGARVYLRNRWIDSTIRIATTVPDAAVDTMSPDGNLVAGRRRIAGGGTDAVWVYRHSTGQTVIVPDTGGTSIGRITAINNDGYYISEVSGNHWFSSAAPMRTGRFLPDGTVTPPSVPAQGDALFAAVTPSLQHAVGFRYHEVAPGRSAYDPVRIDLVSGQSISYLGSATLPAGDDPTTQDLYQVSLSAGISPSGRYVAMSWQTPAGYQLRVWDTTNGTVRAVPMPIPMGTWIADIRGVLDDGRVIAVTADWTMRLFDPAAGTNVELSKAFWGGNTPIGPQFGAMSAQVATDIDRVVLCSQFPLSAFDTNNTNDCYLKPFPPSPLAG